MIGSPHKGERTLNQALEHLSQGLFLFEHCYAFPFEVRGVERSCKPTFIFLPPRLYEYGCVFTNFFPSRVSAITKLSLTPAQLVNGPFGIRRLGRLW